MAQFNVFSMRDTAGAGADARARDEANALARDATLENMDIRRQDAGNRQRAIDDERAFRDLRMLNQASARMVELSQADPEQYERVVPQVIADFERRGLLKAADVGDMDPSEWADLHEITAAQLGGHRPTGGFQKSTPYRVQKEDGTEVLVTPTFNPASGQTELVETPYQGQVLSSLGETPGERSTREVVTAGEKKGAQNEQNRINEIIEVGQRQADITATLRRGIQLLDLVKTGKPAEIQLAAENWFGIAGADETELNANLGKAVLSQLRQTFGAQFTEREGQRLENIEANFGKSTAGNKRLLEQALKMAERAARRAIALAEREGLDWEAEEIQRALDFDLNPDNENDEAQALKEAREAIAAGASQADVAARLTELGYDPGKL